MKFHTAQSGTSFNQGRIVTVGFLLILALTISCKHEPEAGFTRHRNADWFFYLDLPSDWTVNQYSEGDRVVSAHSPNGIDSIFVFTIKTKFRIDIDELAHDVYLNWVGGQTSQRVFRGFLKYHSCILKTYQDDHLFTRVYIMTKDIYGYALVWRGEIDNPDLPDKLARSFKVKIPAYKAWPGRAWRWFLTFVFGLITLLGIGLVSWGLGYLGYSIRSGLLIKKAMRVILSKHAGKPLKDDPNWKMLKRKSTRQIIFPIFGLIALYAFIWIAFSLSIFYVSLAGMIIVGLGYFGILFNWEKSFSNYIESQFGG